LTAKVNHNLNLEIYDMAVRKVLTNPVTGKSVNISRLKKVLTLSGYNKIAWRFFQGALSKNSLF
jgi:hypothetical protein